MRLLRRMTILILPDSSRKLLNRLIFLNIQKKTNKQTKNKEVIIPSVYVGKDLILFNIGSKTCFCFSHRKKITLDEFSPCDILAVSVPTQEARREPLFLTSLGHHAAV